MTRIFIALLIFFVLPARSEEIYDLLLKGGHVIDPKNHRNQKLDIAITSGKIAKIAASIPAAHSRSVVDLGDYYITPGMIDLHAYVAVRLTPNGVDPDHNTLRYGVTTVVDAGSSGRNNFEQFKKDVVDKATVRVLAFLNTGADGMFPSPGGASSATMDAAAIAQVIKKYRQTIVGVRAAAGNDSALKLAESAGAILMADGLPGSARPGDIYSRLYGPDEWQGSQLAAARKKGILFDAGGGMWFRTAIPAIKQGFLPDTISTGVDTTSVMLPRATMTNVMSKFLAMGLTLEQVIERTTINPARAIQRADLGSLEPGGIADIAVFERRKGRFGYLDSGHARMNADTELRCILTIRNGQVVWDSEGLSLADWRNAGPYSNFK